MSTEKYFLIFPPGQRDLHVKQGTLENPAEIDRYHDMRCFVDTSGMGVVEIDEETAIRIAHHLPPSSSIRTGSATGPIYAEPGEPVEPKPKKPKAPKKPRKPREPKKKPGK